METTFISIHDLSEKAVILYSSDSVVDLLGYTPDEIVKRSAWDFFSETDLPYAREFHHRGVSTDKAAVLAYCRVRHKDGQWIGCECCFTIVYDVIVVCTSVYKSNLAAQKRAIEAPMVRRIFSSSPQDPRYHMLSHLSAKFSQPSKAQRHEPRAALFLNRFTRTLTIMYATAGIQDVIGIAADEMRGRSFYYCIAENCLPDAVKCLENAKGNDSIAYLRFWFRDPRIDDHHQMADDSDEEMTTYTSEDQSEGGIHLQDDTPDSSDGSHAHGMDIDTDEPRRERGDSSGDSISASDTHHAIFGSALAAESSHSSLDPSPDRERRSPSRPREQQIELEAVISCASDGLVVCLRKARPMIPHPTHRPARPVYEHGLFAAPWATEPTLPPLGARAGAGFGSAFAPSLGPQGARGTNNVSPVSASRKGGPEQHDFMNAIRDQAIFAWALTGINGSLAELGKGKPRGESVPSEGLPIWLNDSRQASGGASHDSDSRNGSETAVMVTPTTTQNGKLPTPTRNGSFGAKLFGDPGLKRTKHSASRSNEESNKSNHHSPGEAHSG